jgi:hypothetical protein
MAHRESQAGAATLVMAMALLMGAGIWLLAAAKTQLLAQRVNVHEIDALRIRNRLDSLFDVALGQIGTAYYTLTWTRPDRAGDQTHALAIPDTAALAQQDLSSLTATLTRNVRHPRLIRLHVAARPAIDGATEAGAAQYVRPMGILSPAGEAAPPLVIDGCIRGLRGRPDIFPAIAPGGKPPPAVWSSRTADCVATPGLDRHGGTVEGGRFVPGTLWDFLFSIPRDEFIELSDKPRAAGTGTSDRRYWRAQAGDLNGGRWTRSLGTAQKPVALVFPARLGCPPIARGTRIVGVVFYEGGCAGQDRLEGHIYGTLAIAGALGGLRDTLKLAHISHLDRTLPELRFPVRSVLRLPGTWKDFR